MKASAKLSRMRAGIICSPSAGISISMVPTRAKMQEVEIGGLGQPVEAEITLAARDDHVGDARHVAAA